MWSLFDGRDVLAEIDSRFAENVEKHIDLVLRRDPFHVSANTDPKGDRSKPPQEQDPDMLLHAVGETDAGIVVRGAKFETAAAYANQAFTKPTIANWGNQALSDYAVGFICDLSSPGLKFICRAGFAGAHGACPRADHRDYPLANRFDEIDALVIFDDVLVPWGERALLPAHPRGRLHPRHPPPLCRLRVRAAHPQDGGHDDRGRALQRPPDRTREAARGAGEALDAGGVAGRHQRPPERGHRACRALPGRAAHAEPVPALHGRVHAMSNLPAMMHIARELCGGQICVTPNVASFESPATRPWMEKYYSINEDWVAEDRRKLLAFARDLLNSDYAGHRLTFQLFAQSPPFAHLAAVYRNFDWDGPLSFVRKSAGLSDAVMGGVEARSGDSAVERWFSRTPP